MSTYNKNQKRRKPNPSDKFGSFIVNDDIKIVGSVRVVGEGIESKVCTMKEVMEMAENMDLDAVLINQGNEKNVPIVRLCNFEKLVYSMKKEKKQQPKPMKEICLTANIAKHDMETKANSAKKFLSEGMKVKVTLTLKGREMARREENSKSLLEFIVMLEDVGALENPPKGVGNKTFAILKPKK